MPKIDFPSARLFPRLWDVVGIFLLFLFTTVAVLVPIFLVIIALGGEISLSDPSLMYGALTLGYALPMIATIWLTVKLARISPRFNFRPNYPQLIPVFVMGWFLLLVVEEGLMKLLPDSESQFRLLLDLVKAHPLAMFLTLAVAAPVLEEMLFRGIILKYMLKKMPPWRAIVLSGLIFGIFHMNVWQLVGATLLGIYFGYVYWRTGSLFHTILLHALNNGLAFWMAWKSGDLGEDLLVSPSAGETVLRVLMALAGLVAFVLFLEAYFRKRERTVIYLASANPHKAREMRAVLPRDMELRPMTDLDPDIRLDETGRTLEENSLQKAYQLARRFAVNVLADDTGLEVDALDGAPGVYSARFAGEEADDAANRSKLLEQMESRELRSARFRTVLTLLLGHEWFRFQGTVPGEITREPRGQNGFGYDPVFRPQGSERSFAEMTADEKNRISHRARAMQKLAEFLRRKRPENQ